jgi:diguanylate cyclase (GGDEF)-like protein
LGLPETAAGWPRHLAVYDWPQAADASRRARLRDLADLAQREFLTAELCDAQAQIVAKLDLARRSAMIDALTRVWNRRAAEELLAVAMEQAERDDTALALCMLDVDAFKEINDNSGHQVGDQVLARLRQRWSATCATATRVPLRRRRAHAHPAEHRDEVERSPRIRQRISEFPMKTKSGQIPVSISTGTSHARPPYHQRELLGSPTRRSIAQTGRRTAGATSGRPAHRPAGWSSAPSATFPPGLAAAGHGGRFSSARRSSLSSHGALSCRCAGCPRSPRAS